MTPETLTVATIALEKVIEGDLDEAQALVGQLDVGDQEALWHHVAKLFSIVNEQFLVKRLS